MRKTIPAGLGSAMMARRRRGRVVRFDLVTAVDEQDVDVARVVQLAPAQLAHSDHGQRRLGRGDQQRTPEAHLGERCELASDRGEVGHAEEVPGCDPEVLAALPPPQPVGILDGVGGRGALVLVDRLLAGEALGIAQRVDQRRVLDQGCRQGPRRARDRDQCVADEAVVAHLEGQVGLILEDPGECSARGVRIGRMLQGPSDAGRVENGNRARHPVQCRAVTVPPYPCGMPRLRLAAAQLDLVVGDLAGNSARMLEAYERADAASCDLIAFPELAVTGYPPEDLLLKPAFVAQATESLEKLAARTGRLAAVIGFPEAGRDLYNSVALCANGKVQGVYRKHLLPNYAVFDEQRYFAPSTVDGPLFVVAGVRVGITVCEDAWSPTGPIITQAAGGAELIVNVNASPYYAGRIHERETMLATRAADAQVPVAYVNLVGGQDELVFDGASMVFDESGALVARGTAVRRGPSDRGSRRPSRVPAPAPRPAWPHHRRRRCPRSR